MNEPLFAYQEKKNQISDFKTLLENNKSATIHFKNFHNLVTGYTKFKIKFLRILRFFIFQENSNYCLRSGINLALRNTKTTLFETETA